MSIQVDLSQIADIEMGVPQTPMASKARWRSCWEAGPSLADTNDSHTWLTGSQMMLELLAHGPHIEEQGYGFLYKKMKRNLYVKIILWFWVRGYKSTRCVERFPQENVMFYQIHWMFDIILLQMDFKCHFSSQYLMTTILRWQKKQWNSERVLVTNI